MKVFVDECIDWRLARDIVGHDLAVVGGFLPYGGILSIGVRNLFDPSLLLFSLVHLGVYGLLLYWISGLIARGLDKVPGAGAWLATAVVLVLIAGVGALPVFGIAHGQIQWTSAYDIYASGKLRQAGHRRTFP